jgi:hypothetical protein
LRRALQAPSSYDDQLDYDAWLAGVRSQLDEAAFAAACAEGSTMTLEQAVEYAVGRSDQAGSLPP